MRLCRQATSAQAMHKDDISSAFADRSMNNFQAQGILPGIGPAG